MMRKAGVIAAVMLYAVAAGSAEEKGKPVKLPAPDMAGGKPLMQALKERKSTRSFSSKKLPPQILSNLLWAANGINRLDSGKRTAPSAKDMREIEVYAAMEDGLFLYDPKGNSLEPVLAKDIRGSSGEQPFVKNAPVVLIFAANYGKMTEGTDKDFYAATDTGYVSQNVYLYCASEGLATVVLGWVKKADLAKAMGLKDDMKVILTQPVGYPKD